MIVVAVMTALAVVVINAAQAQSLADKQWDDLYARGALRVGIDPGWQPFSFYDATGWQGLDADLARDIARRMNLQVQTNPVGYDSMYDALHLWQVDVVVSAVVVDPSRTAEYAYSHSYFDAGLHLVTLPGSPVRAVNDLPNKRVAVALGSEADREARYWVRRMENLTRVVVGDEESALAAVKSGEVDAAILEGLTAARLGGQTAAQVAQWQMESIAPQPYAIVVRRDNPRLLAAVNQALDQMRADGTLESIVKRWTAK